jgi:hypothetical protein
MFDIVHRDLISNPGVPVWWPGWCLSYDVTAGAYLAVLLKRSKTMKNRPESQELRAEDGPEEKG